MLYILSMGALATALVLPAAAQEKRSGKLGEYDEIVIRKKSDGKNGKVTIEIKDGEVLADGKPLNEYKNEQVIVQRRHIVPRNGNLGDMDMPFSFDDGETDNRLFAIEGNKAVLGVITEKKEAGGTTVVEVSEGSAAEKAGLKTGDLITAVDGKKIAEPKELYEFMGEKKPGDKVTVTYKRNGKENKAAATLEERKENAPRVFNFPSRPDNQFRFRRDNLPPFGGEPGPGIRNSGRPRLGLAVQDTEEGNGAKVVGVTKGSPAEKAGFAENDLVTEIAGEAVKNAAEVAAAYREHSSEGSVAAKVLRKGKTETLTIKVPKNLRTENL